MSSRRLAGAGQLLAAASGRLRALSRVHQRAAVAIGAIVAVVLAIAIVVAVGLPGSSPAASSGKKVAGATTVQRRDLVATDTESGTLTYASPQTVFNRLSGTITWLPTVGQLVKPGQTLYQVDGQPVVLFNGTTPAYRDLTSGISDGPDVLELNRDLVNMGFDPGHEITVNNSWQTGTTDAVERWQVSVGASQTGTISLGQVVFLPGTQRITSVETVLGSTGGSGAGAGAGAAAGSGSSSGSGAGAGSGATSGSGSTTGASTTASQQTEFVSLTTGGAATSATSGVATGGRTAGTAATIAAWDAACAAHEMQRAGWLKRAHPTLLASLQPSSCATPSRSTDPTSANPTAPGAASGSGAGSANGPVEASRIAPTATSSPLPSSASPTPPTPTTSNRSGHRPSAGARGKTGGSSANNTALLRALEALLKAETLELRRSTGPTGRSAANVSSPSGASGAGRLSGSPSGGGSLGGGGATGSSGSSAGGNPILGTTSTQLNVVVNLDATKQSEAVIGEPVTVQMPDGSVVDGKITEVSPVAQSSSGNGSSNGSGSGSGSSGAGGSSSAPTSTVPVTIALHGRLPASGLDQAAVSVNFEQQVERGVLSVPVTALLATAGGGYAIQEAASAHRLIPVTPGLFAAGYVQISSSQIYPGLQVTDSQG